MCNEKHIGVDERIYGGATMNRLLKIENLFCISFSVLYTYIYMHVSSFLAHRLSLPLLYTHTHTHTLRSLSLTHSHTHTLTHSHTHTLTLTHKHTNTQTHIHTHIYIHIYFYCFQSWGVWQCGDVTRLLFLAHPLVSWKC